MGLQLLFFCFSLRASWVSLFESDPTQPVSRDLSEAVLNAHSHFIPRLGWLIQGGAALGLSEPTVLNITLVLLLSTGLLLVIGLFSRSAAVAAWFLHLCAVKSANLMTYGVDNFATIGLFYLMFAPLPDRFALDYARKKAPQANHNMPNLCQRVLQLHLCIVYFFSGLTKSLGIGWWNGISFWRAITSPPFDVIPAHTWAILTPALPLLGIGVFVLEIGYPVFIWLRRTRLIWFSAVIAMHVAIGLTMGLYLFAFVMIVLNFAAFGPHVFPFLDKITPSKAGILRRPRQS
jgi:Vitamin K-dependent gamma-carboxylase